MPTPGRPRVLDDIKRREILALIASGCGLNATAKYIRCSPRTIRREACANPEFRKAMKRAQLKAQLAPIKNLRRAAKSHWRAAAWLLERSRPFSFVQSKPNQFRPDDVQDLFDGVICLIGRIVPDRKLAATIVQKIEAFVDRRSQRLAEMPQENHRRKSSRRDDQTGDPDLDDPEADSESENDPEASIRHPTVAEAFAWAKSGSGSNSPPTPNEAAQNSPVAEAPQNSNATDYLLTTDKRT